MLATCAGLVSVCVGLICDRCRIDRCEIDKAEDPGVEDGSEVPDLSPGLLSVGFSHTLRVESFMVAQYLNGTAHNKRETKFPRPKGLVEMK